MEQSERLAKLTALGLSITSVYTDQGKPYVKGYSKGEPSAWRVAVIGHHGSVVSDYTQGCAHREYRKPRGSYCYHSKFSPVPQHCKDWETGQAIIQTSRPTEPDLCGVLYCLVMDASAGEQTFSDWCGECGADEDSIKARDMYHACQSIYDQMRRAQFPLAEIREILADY
jgi:hypothetical protein